MNEFTSIVGIMFFGGYAVSVLIPHKTSQKIARVISGVAGAILALQLLVGVL